MDRDPEAREKSQILLEELLEIYQVNDPKFGYSTELEKINNAHKVVDIFWQLFDLLGFWAQCHLASLARAEFDAPYSTSVVDESPGIHEDSHQLEDLGFQFLIGIQAAFELKDGLYFQDDKDHLKQECLGNQILRRLIFQLLASQSQLGNSWRFPLLRASRALNDGQYDPLFTPRPQRRVGRSFDLSQWKLEALLQVNYRIGIGWKKYRALEVVTDAIGQSVETLRDWEKELKTDRDYEAELHCAELAGRLEQELEQGDTLGGEYYGVYRGKLIIERANDLLPAIKARDLQQIASKIKEYRSKETGE